MLEATVPPGAETMKRSSICESEEADGSCGEDHWILSWFPSEHRVRVHPRSSAVIRAPSVSTPVLVGTFGHVSTRADHSIWQTKLPKLTMDSGEIAQVQRAVGPRDPGGGTSLPCSTMAHKQIHSKINWCSNHKYSQEHWLQWVLSKFNGFNLCLFHAGIYIQTYQAW